MVLGQDQKAAVIGDQVQTVVLMAEIPANPPIPRGALPGRGGKAQQGQPLVAPSRHIPQRVADLRQRSQVMMGLQQRLKTRLVGARYGLKGDLAKVQAQHLGPLDVSALNTLAPGNCPERGKATCPTVESWLEPIRPACTDTRSDRDRSRHPHPLGGGSGSC